MILWRTRALIGASAAALLIAFVPFRNGAVHEFGVLKRIAEDRAALAAASMLSAAALPRDAGNWAEKLRRLAPAGRARGQGRVRRDRRALRAAPAAGRRSRGVAAERTEAGDHSRFPRGARLSQGRRRDAHSARESCERSRRAAGAGMGGAAHGPASAGRGAGRLRRGPPDLAWERLYPLPPGSRASRSLAFALGGRRVFRRRAAAVERRQARACARRRRDGPYRTKRSGRFASSGATTISTHGRKA